MRQTVTIKEGVKRCKDDGLCVSEYALRLWIKQGLIPHVTAGKSKVLLFYPNLYRFVTGAEYEGGV